MCFLNAGYMITGMLANPTRIPNPNPAQVCFLNAGYMITGMFEQNSAAAHLANLHCNLTANVHLAHYLYGRLLSSQKPGCLVFTSSSAGFIPTPFAAMYATSKAAISV